MELIEGAVFGGAAKPAGAGTIVASPYQPGRCGTGTAPARVQAVTADLQAQRTGRPAPGPRGRLS